MKKPERPTHPSGGVNIGGHVNTGGGDITGRDHVEVHITGGVDAAAQAFAPIYARIQRLEGLSETDRQDLTASAKEIQTEVAKGPKADEPTVQRRLREVGRMAPDILEVILSTLANPLLGLGLVAKKIAEKAAEAPAAAKPPDHKPAG